MAAALGQYGYLRRNPYRAGIQLHTPYIRQQAQQRRRLEGRTHVGLFAGRHAPAVGSWRRSRPVGAEPFLAGERSLRPFDARRILWRTRNSRRHWRSLLPLWRGRDAVARNDGRNRGNHRFGGDRHVADFLGSRPREDILPAALRESPSRTAHRYSSERQAQQHGRGLLLRHLPGFHDLQLRHRGAHRRC